MRMSIILFIPLLVFAQDFEFTQEYDSIPVQIDGYSIPVPWTGGYAQSSPVFCDIDENSTFDLFLGNSTGSIAQFNNLGTSSLANFSLVSEEFQEIGVESHSVIDFNDIDGDGDFDLFYDCANYPMRLYENIGSIFQPDFSLVQDTLFDTENNRIDGTDFDLIDIDADNDLDLFTGVWYSGEIKFYENIGDSTSCMFQLNSDNFTGSGVGYWASPCFVDINDDGDFDLFIGNKYGNIWYYENIGDSINYDFSLVSSNWLSIDVGDYASPEFCDIDGDGDYDLFIGKDNDFTYDIPGAVHYWENIGTPQSPQFIEITESFLTFDAGNCCEPDLCDIDLDGDFDLFFLTNARLRWLENVGSLISPAYQFHTFDLLDLPPGSCDLADLSGDGIADLVTVNGWGGSIDIWFTEGTPPDISFQHYQTINTGYLLYEVTLGDLDADGDQDLVVGGSENMEPHLYHYQNQGTPSNPNFVLVGQSLPGVSYDNVLQSCLLDFDLDADLDLLIHSNWSTQTSYYENIGTPQQMNFQLASNDLLETSLILAVVDGADLDDDGDVDIISGHYDGGMKFFRNTTGDTSAVNPPLIQHPLHGIEMTFGPNPVNPAGIARFDLPYASYVNLGVYDITGRLVKPLASDFLLPGPHQFRWDAEDAASGVYMLRLQANNAMLTKKVIVLR